MLVLSRKTGEKVRIGGDVTVTIVRIGPNTVRLGIEAPRDVNIVREELVGVLADGHVEIELPLAAEGGSTGSSPCGVDLSGK